MADDLIDFLRKRLTEDERGAHAASPGPWTYGDIDSVAGGTIYDPTVAVASVDWDNDRPDPRIRRHRPVEQADATGEHIARHDPARVLREVEAKSALLDAMIGPSLSTAVANTCDAGLATARFLALAYADHPDYRSEWTPQHPTPQED